MTDSDNNTRFFHASATSRRRRNEIRKIKNSRGEWCSEKRSVRAALLEHFQGIFTSEHPREDFMEMVVNAIQPAVTTEMNDRLNQPFTVERVKIATFNMYPLNHLVQMAAERRNDIQGIAISRTAPRISHLLFADDTIIFGKANEAIVHELKSILDIYGQASGQRINLDKSSIVISPNVEDHQRHQIADILGVQLIARHDKYLGLPAVVGKSRRELFQSLRDRMWSRIEGWESRLLSQAGKGVLIKSVLQSIPIYVMSCFQLLKTFIHELESMMANFWWHSMGTRRIHWIAWKELCQPNDRGGLGFQQLEPFNIALLAKQGWTLLTRPHNLVG
ncbi:UNVERIFIED_CONTAM: hypothetical protein Sradi_0175200 [Sesamum radiatum]|uniref:Reverse transcriptase n=1 Tax=Sesamum radiatum TaxID=300843 RepID=A0AAW2W020_SESRA